MILLRAEGPAAVQAVLDRALPMVQLLWQRETEAREFDSPERRAALDKTLREKIGLIRDSSIRHHYGQAIKELRWQLFNPRGGQQGMGRSRVPKGSGAPVRASTKSSLLAVSGDEVQSNLREAVILATLLRNPTIIEEFEPRIEKLSCVTTEHAQLRDLLLRHSHAGAETLWAQIADAMGEDAVEKLCARPHVALVPAVRRADDEEMARQTVAEELAKLDAEQGLKTENQRSGGRYRRGRG